MPAPMKPARTASWTVTGWLASARNLVSLAGPGPIGRWLLALY